MNENIATESPTNNATKSKTRQRPRARPRKPPAPASKSTIVIKLLSRAKGSTVAEISTATGWQPHSVRAFLSGLRKKGISLEREERRDGVSSYRLLALIAELAAPTPPPEEAAATLAPEPQPAAQ